MSLPDDKIQGAPTQEIGAVPVTAASVEPTVVDAAQSHAATTEQAAQAARVQAAADVAAIRGDVAQTDTRRAEEQVAKAADSIEQAQEEHAEAERQVAEARDREEQTERDARDARAHAQAVGGTSSTVAARGFSEAPAGDPIVFGPFTAERPELLVLAALAGGFVVAKLIRRMAGS